jgi:hypothetical protein
MLSVLHLDTGLVKQMRRRSAPPTSIQLEIVAQDAVMETVN